MIPLLLLLAAEQPVLRYIPKHDELKYTFGGVAPTQLTTRGLEETKAFGLFGDECASNVANLLSLVGETLAGGDGRALRSRQLV